MKLLMPITSAPIGRNRHMSISHRRDKPFIMAVIARYTRVGAPTSFTNRDGL